MEKTQSGERVRRGLLALDSVFNKTGVSYRVLGSVLVAALNGKPHRTLGDIDVLIEKKDFEKITRKLESLGYAIEKKSKLGFYWYEALKEDSLGFTFLLMGEFTDKYFTYSPSRWFELRIDSDYLVPTKRSLFEVTFVGIPTRSIYEGLKISSLNPKRSADREVVAPFLKGKIPGGIKLEDAFHVLIFGKEIPHLYQFFSWVYNIFGGIRVLLGKKYEVWK